MTNATWPNSNLIKERISLAYVQAVAARVGYEVIEPKVDVDSVDGLLRSTVGRRPQIEFQAKCSSQDYLRVEEVAFPLKLKNYNELRAETINPRLLIVLLLPPNEADWVLQSEDELIMKKCAYWLSLRNYPPSDNAAQVTVRLPRSQLFSSQQLVELMAKAQIGPNL